MSRVAYLGPEGTFTEAALVQLAAGGSIPGTSRELTQLPCDSAEATLAAVRAGDADYACAPIENSIEGSVVPTMDSLAAGAPLQIYAEHTLDVAFSVVVRPGTQAADVATVAAYPVARAQVKRWLAEHLPGADAVPTSSNAAAARDVAAGRADAGISTALAAERLGLTSLAAGIVDESNARTRFVLVGPPGPPPARTGADRTSVVLRLVNEPGALVAAMAELAMRDIDLTRIESRPTRIELGTYVFFLDCVGHIDDDPVAEALRALHRRCADVRYLGSWPTGAAGAAGGIGPPATDDASGWLAGLRDGRPPMTGRLVLVRHGQSHGNVARRLDTRPPGAALTELGHEQARTFARDWNHPVGMIVHSTALRARETAVGIGEGLGIATGELDGIFEVQVGDLENRSDDAAIDDFNAVYRRWHGGDLEVPMPGGETGQQVLDRYLPVVTQLRLRHLDDDAWGGDVVVVSHGAAIRLVAAVLAGVGGGFALDHHLANTECVALSPITDGRWSCVQWAALTPPFAPESDGHPVEDALHVADPMG